MDTSQLEILCEVRCLAQKLITKRHGAEGMMVVVRSATYPMTIRFSQLKTKAQQEGTTLAELLIVITVIALAAVLTVPNIGRSIARYKLKIAAREISNFLQETRTEAMKNADMDNPVPYRVVFDSTLGTYTRQKYQSGSWVNDGPTKTLPTSISIGNLLPTDINSRYFRADGSSVVDVGSDTDPTNDQFDASPVTLRVQLRNTRNDRYEVNLFSLTGLSEIKEGWSS